MANTIKERNLDPIMAELQRMGAQPNGPLWEFFRYAVKAMDKTITPNGAIQSKANITGRTEQISTTLQNVDSAGKLTTADAIAADGSTFGRVNIAALTSNNVDLAKTGVTNKTAANIAETSNLKWRTASHSAAGPVSVSITGIDNGGGQASVSVLGFNLRVPGLSDIAEPAGAAVGLLNSTTYYIYYDDPNFAGTGSITVTTDPTLLLSNPGRFYIGKVTTPAGGAGNTTGVKGGNGGSVNRDTVLA